VSDELVKAAGDDVAEIESAFVTTPRVDASLGDHGDRVREVLWRVGDDRPSGSNGAVLSGLR
jgi:hypothetical protein